MDVMGWTSAYEVMVEVRWDKLLSSRVLTLTSVRLSYKVAFPIPHLPHLVHLYLWVIPSTLHSFLQW
mgnify:CR=1 FL=1